MTEEAVEEPWVQGGASSGGAAARRELHVDLAVDHADGRRSRVAVDLFHPIGHRSTLG